MKILIVRHAIAEALDPFELPRKNDSERALTFKGRVKMEEITRGLSRVVDHIDIIAHSPLLRAKQTAKILRAGFRQANLMQLKELQPGADINEMSAWLDLVTRGEVVTLIGHEPDLSSLVGWLCAGEADGFIKLKKGGAVMLSCKGKPGPGCAKMQWMLTPKQLSALAV